MVRIIGRQRVDANRLEEAGLSTIAQSAFALVPEHSVSPRSYGVCLHGGLYHELIRPSTRLPFMGAELFETAESYVRVGKIKVACSSSPFDPPTTLAECEVLGIQVAEAGVPKAKVTMHLDEQLRGSCTIRDIATGSIGQCNFNGNIYSIDNCLSKPRS